MHVWYVYVCSVCMCGICGMWRGAWWVVGVRMCTYTSLKRGKVEKVWRCSGCSLSELMSKRSCTCVFSAASGLKLKFIFVELHDPNYL